MVDSGRYLVDIWFANIHPTFIHIEPESWPFPKPEASGHSTDAAMAENVVDELGPEAWRSSESPALMMSSAWNIGVSTIKIKGYKMILVDRTDKWWLMIRLGVIFTLYIYIEDYHRPWPWNPVLKLPGSRECDAWSFNSTCSTSQFRSRGSR